MIILWLGPRRILASSFRTKAFELRIKAKLWHLYSLKIRFILRE